MRLIDTRYEVRDAQEFAGELVDEGLIDPQKIGAIGGSYGGGMSMALAALKDRTMLPDGSPRPLDEPRRHSRCRSPRRPRTSPGPTSPTRWRPNGSTLDYVADSPYRGRFGVMKESLVNGLYVSGLGAPGFYAPLGHATRAPTSPGWKTLLDAGEPYDGDPAAQAVARRDHHHTTPPTTSTTRPSRRRC